PAPLGPAPEPGEHIGRGINAVDVEAEFTQLEQRIAVPAPEFEGGLAKLLDEAGVTLGREGGRFQLTVRLGHEPGVESIGGGLHLDPSRARPARGAGALSRAIDAVSGYPRRPRFNVGISGRHCRYATAAPAVVFKW